MLYLNLRSVQKNTKHLAPDVYSNAEKVIQIKRGAFMIFKYRFKIINKRLAYKICLCTKMVFMQEIKNDLLVYQGIWEKQSLDSEPEELG